MSVILFNWLHSQSFYQEFNNEIINFINQKGKNKTLIDLGSGPGILSSIAADNGFNVIGIDQDKRMLEKAKANTNLKDNVQFLTPEEFELSGGYKKSQVVVLNSLLVVVKNKKEFLDQLIGKLSPETNLYFVETNQNFTMLKSFKLYLKRCRFLDLGLILFGYVRQGRNSTNQFLESYFQNYEQVKILNSMITITKVVI